MSATTRISEIFVNGQRLDTETGTLAALLDEQGFSGVKVATALNGEFVPEKRRAETAVQAGDRVEIVSVRQGG